MKGSPELLAALFTAVDAMAMVMVFLLTACLGTLALWFYRIHRRMERHSRFDESKYPDFGDQSQPLGPPEKAAWERDPDWWKS